KREMINLIGEGFNDVSFSRSRDVLPWGITVPDDESQLIYVWCDALVNYISALNFENGGDDKMAFWPADLQIVGKDILRFHGGIWLGMLLALDLPLPRKILVHGYITVTGQKMSKSLGNVLSPDDLLEKYGCD